MDILPVSLRIFRGMWNRRHENEKALPVFFLYGKVLFPHCSIEVKTKSDLAERLEAGGEAVVLPVRHMLDLAFSRGKTGTLARVVSLEKQESLFRIEFKGLRRVRVRKVGTLRNASFTELEDVPEAPDIVRLETLRRKAQELIFLVNIDRSDKLIHLLEFIASLRQLSDFVGNYFVLGFPPRRKLLDIVDPGKRADRLLVMLGDIIRDLKKKKGLPE